ncbi:MAG: hypothetical protein IJ565_02945 [Bacilli bacterium]|nr:hypothetical protein [Bacilli bacterium]
MKKILKPKTLAIITIATIIIGFAISTISNIVFVSDMPNSIKTTRTLTTIVGFFTNVNLYIIIYLLIILKKKEKNMRTLNLILFIWLIVSLIIYIVGQVNYINQIHSISISVSSLGKFQMWFNLISNALFMVLEIIMVYGILNKKKMPYKFLMILLIILTLISLIPFVISSYSYLKYNEYITYNPYVLITFNFLGTINGIIKSCSFVLFLYLYGKSINERSLKNER